MARGRRSAASRALALLDEPDQGGDDDQGGEGDGREDPRRQQQQRYPDFGVTLRKLTHGPDGRRSSNWYSVRPTTRMMVRPPGGGPLRRPESVDLFVPPSMVLRPTLDEIAATGVHKLLEVAAASRRGPLEGLLDGLLEEPMAAVALLVALFAAFYVGLVFWAIARVPPMMG
jgi:hypothetical protein